MKFKFIQFIIPALILFTSCAPQGSENDNDLKFKITFSEQLGSEALDGRVLLMISDNDDREPRFQISDGPATQLVYGINVNGLAPGQEVIIDNAIFGYPLQSISEIPSVD